MRESEKNLVTLRVITCEVLAFTFLVIFVWLDEILDLPHMMWGAESTLVNWRESLVESIIIILTGGLIINFTVKLFRKMKVLEGILPICSSCKRIRDKKGNWFQFESYISNRSEAEFTHGICPECAMKLYPELHEELE